MSDAELLRRAASEMRRRAEAATPGPWHVPRRGFGIDAGEFDTVIGPGRVDCMAYCYGGSSTIDGDRLDADQAHIASWHPAVAFKVARVLQSIAEHIASHDCEAHCEPGGRAESRDAYDLARAYLQEQP